MTGPRNDNARGQAGEVGTASTQKKLSGEAKVQDAESTRKYIACASIRLDGDTQPRAEINLETVADYAEAVAEQAPFPPVIVFNDGASMWLADGFHRVHAHRKAGMTTILADVRPGTRRDAMLYGFGANTRHGLRETRTDKRRKIEAMLRDDEWVQWSDREIARKCGVSDKTVGAVRGELVGRAEIPHVDTRTDSAGRQQPAVKAASSSETPRIEQPADDETNPEQPVTVEPAQPTVVVSVAPPAPPTEAPMAALVKPAADGEVERLRAENAELREHLAEMAKNLEEAIAEIEVLHRITEADDQAKSALEEVRRVSEHNRILEERVRGLTGKNAEAIKAVKRWQRKAEQAGGCA